MRHVGWSCPATAEYYLKLANVIKASAPADLLAQDSTLWLRRQIFTVHMTRLRSLLLLSLVSRCLPRSTFYCNVFLVRGVGFGWVELMLFVFVLRSGLWGSLSDCHSSNTQRSASKIGVNRILFTTVLSITIYRGLPHWINYHFEQEVVLYAYARVISVARLILPVLRSLWSLSIPLFPPSLY